MVWVLVIGGSLVGLVGLFVLWGILHLRGSRKQATAEISGIELADIEPLARECVRVFQNKLGVRLELDDLDGTAQKLDDAFQDVYKLKEAFAKEDFYWYFVKAVGACLGELLRLHAKHEWRKQPGEAPFLEVVWPGGSSQAFPFDKVIKQSQSGTPRDLVAYVEFARTVAEQGPE
jgi:hypothetical protein